MAFNHSNNCDCPVGCCDCSYTELTFSLGRTFRNTCDGRYITFNDRVVTIATLRTTMIALSALGSQFDLARYAIKTIYERLLKDHEKEVKKIARKERGTK